MPEMLLAPPFPRSAVMAAAARAAHLLVDRPPYLHVDEVAARLLDADGTEPIGYHLALPDNPLLRAVRVEATCRARLADDVVLTCPARQVVVLGAGLDTFAHRHPRSGTDVYEVDLPSAQRAKQAAVARAELDSPVRYVPADLSRDSLAPALRAAGADPAASLVVTALGLTMYLDRDAVADLLAQVAGWPGGAELVADHLLPADDEAARQYTAGVGSAVADGGEAWRSRLTGSQMAALCREAGFTQVRTLRPEEAVPDLLRRRADGLRPGTTSGFVHAGVGPTSEGTVSGR
ncbi:MAG: class I SAM-dependent methyltransferase [Actinobacteria bacterium]|nr:class I SAM-dependent methyltransferase [Actinomycetota bacterium]MCG2797892.1 class I SAM-dependent methyltransferase [Cellulomonas sp.]